MTTTTTAVADGLGSTTIRRGVGLGGLDTTIGALDTRVAVGGGGATVQPTTTKASPSRVLTSQRLERSNPAPVDHVQ